MAILSRKDQRLLNRVDLPTRHKAYLEELWIENPCPQQELPKKVGILIINLVLRLLLPAMCVVLLVHLMYPEAYVQPFLRLVRFCVWGLAFLGVAVNGLLLLMVLGGKDLRVLLAGRGIVLFLVRQTVWGRVVTGLHISLILLLIMVGWGFTALMYLGGWMTMLILHQVGKGVTQKAVEVLYDRDQGNVVSIRNVTRI